MKRYLLVLFLLQMAVSGVKADSLRVDSIYNLIVGQWYFIDNCGGISGGCNTPPILEVSTIARIEGTDSITWVGAFPNNFKIGFQQSITRLIEMPFLYENGDAKYIINVTNSILTLREDMVDSYEMHYSRTPTSLVKSNGANNGIKLSFVPNPTNSYFNIEGVDEIDHINIYDINGILMVTKAGNCDTIEHIDISNLAKGLYFVEVTLPTGIVTGKIRKL